MIKYRNPILCIVLAIVCIISYITPAFAEDETSYLALGADLSESEKATVLEKLGVSEAELSNYNVVEITNEEEKEYLQNYVSEDVIGSRALSSALVTKQESGYGIHVSTYNISYCTIGMYKNALITAGITDADVKVAGPFEISGTAALVGIIKSYESMTGEEVSEENADTAVDELVTTGELAESVGDSETVEELIAAVKQYIVENNLESAEDIESAVRDIAAQLDITLSDEEVQAVVTLMQKIATLDIDEDALKTQASELYNKLKDLGIDIQDEGFQEKVKAVFEAIVDFFRGLFS